MFAIVIFVVLLSAGWLYWVIKGRRAAQLADQWEGAVIEKMPVADDKQPRRYVSVEFNDGKHAYVEINAGLWKTLRLGDKLVKHLGSYEPVKGDNPSRNA